PGESYQRETAKGDRERVVGLPYRRSVVAVFPDRAHYAGAIRRELAEGCWRPRRCARVGRSFMARGRHAISEILERGWKGQERVFGNLLLLEGRTAAAAERTAAGRHRRNPSGVGRPCVRVFHNTYGHAPESEHADGWCLLARGSRGHDHPRRTRRPETCRVDRGKIETLEVDQDWVSSAECA